MAVKSKQLKAGAASGSTSKPFRGLPDSADALPARPSQKEVETTEMQWSGSEGEDEDREDVASEAGRSEGPADDDYDIYNEADRFRILADLTNTFLAALGTEDPSRASLTDLAYIPEEDIKATFDDMLSRKLMPMEKGKLLRLHARAKAGFQSAAP
jgi:hypothetical protein